MGYWRFVVLYKEGNTRCLRFFAEDAHEALYMLFSHGRLPNHGTVSYIVCLGLEASEPEEWETL